MTKDNQDAANQSGRPSCNGAVISDLRSPAASGLRRTRGVALGSQPIGQIAYHDSKGRLTAFCIKRNPTGTTQDLKQTQFFGRLQMIHWQDEPFQYAVVGFEDFETLEPVATWLAENYSEDA